MNAIRTTNATSRTATNGSGITFRRTTIDDQQVVIGQVCPQSSAEKGFK
jgi:hypothetical protein